MYFATKRKLEALEEEKVDLPVVKKLHVEEVHTEGNVCTDEEDQELCWLTVNSCFLDSTSQHSISDSPTI